MSDNPWNILVLHLQVVAGGVGLELAGASVVGDPEAVAALIQVEGGVPVQGDPIVMAAHPIRKGTLLIAAVNWNEIVVINVVAVVVSLTDI